MVVSIDINELICIGKSLTLEYKSSFDRESIETLVAFANANGGIVLVGVEDNGTVLGVSLGKETLNKWLGQVKSSTSPSIIPDTERLILMAELLSPYVSVSIRLNRSIPGENILNGSPVPIISSV